MRANLLSTFIVMLATAVIVSGCDRTRGKGVGLQQEEGQIATAVLLDVMEQEEARRAPLFCVAIANVPGSVGTDPLPATLASLRSKNTRTYAASECDVSASGVRHRTAGAGALIGVGRPEIGEREVAKATGWVFIGNFNARSWIYTLNRVRDEWVVATAKLEGIS